MFLSILLLTLLLLFILAVTHFYKVGKKLEDTKNKYVSDISSANPVNDLKKFITENKERYVLYVGRFSCSDCRGFSPLFKDLMIDYPNIQFYSYDTDKIRNNNSLYHEDDIFLTQYLEVTHVPSLILMDSGNKLDYITETEITKFNFDRMVTSDAR